MAVMRVIPYAYPTIQGQATNENPTPEGQDNIDYLNLDSVNVEMYVDIGSSTWSRIYGSKCNIQGVKVNDVTGVSVIERFSVPDYYVEGVDGNGKPFELKVSAANKNIPCGTVYDREIKIKDEYTTNYPDGMKDARLKNPVKGTLTIQVVNGMGLVMQTKTFEKELKLV